MGKALIIKGANFSANAISGDVIIDNNEYDFVPKCGMNTVTGGFIIQNNNARGNVFITRASTTNPTSWATTSNSNTTLQGAYSMITIPTGATFCRIKMTNTSYYYGLSLRNNTTILYDSGWTQGGTALTVDLTQYSGALYVTSTFKIGSAGTASFNNETLQSVGFSIEWS